MFTHTGHVMTLANSIIGVGILAMPFCFQKCGILLAILLLFLSNWITRICCHYLIKSSLLTRRKSFEFLGFHAFGSSGKLFVELCIIGYLLGACVTYFVVVGDLGPQIITKMFTLDYSLTHLRLYFMFAVTLLCILPLAMLKNVDSLSTVCTASIGFYVCLVIKIILESESHIIANDWKTNVVYWRPAGVLQCLPIFSMALSCQMQLFEVFKSVNNQSVEKLNGIVRGATWICTLVYIAVGFFGYVAFCTQTFSGNILLNFSPSFGSDVIKIGFILSVAFSFPLVIFPCRASIYSLLYRKGHADASGGFIPETRFKMITIFIVGLTLCIALMIPFVELIIGLVGSTIGIAICVMFPAATFRKITKKNQNERSLALSGIILVSGFCLMVLGTYANLQAIDEQRSGTHLNNENFQNKFIKPTEMPSIKEEVQKLLNEKVNVVVAKEIQLENSKFPKAEDKKVKKLNEIQLEKIQINQVLVVTEPQAPILPVDEVHQSDDNIKKYEKGTNMEKPEIFANKNINLAFAKGVQILKNNGNEPLADDGSIKVKEPLPIALIKESPAQSVVDDDARILGKALNATQQTIDKDAIKKEEDIAAEEHQSKSGTKNIEAELKITQTELKKTKELLRKVDEMKEELVQQNKKTQDLVVEKLVQVVEKVEKIDRELQQKKNDETKVSLTKSADAVLDKLIEVAEVKQKAQVNSKALSKNNDNKMNEVEEIKINDNKLQIENDLKANKIQVYEPLSYKTGEIIENARNISKLEHNLPLPLPLLINASRIQPNGKEELPQLVHLKHQNLPQAPIDAKNSIQPKLEHPLPVEQKENVEAIRRDLLVLNPNKLGTMSTIAPSQNELNESQKRFKRSYNVVMPDVNANVAKLCSKSLLKEPKLDALLQHGSSGALDFNIQGIGRELKSLKNEKSEHT